MKYNFYLLLLSLLGYSFFITSCGNEEKKGGPDKVPEAASILKNYSGKDLYAELMFRMQKRKSNEKGIPKSDTIPIPDSTFKIIHEQLKIVTDKDLYDELWAIYGIDNRHNFYDKLVQTDKAILNNTLKVACIVYKTQLKPLGNGTFSLTPTGKYTSYDGSKFCDNERFYNEPVASFCSGFAVSKNTFVSAGHCLNASSIKDVVFIYGFCMKDSLTANLIINEKDVFTPTEIIKWEYDKTTKNDFCLVKVNKQIPDDKITSIRKTGKVSDNQEVYVIGYPSGLPVKVTPFGRVQNNTISNYFITNLDTYGGNSGSAVFNSITHQVEGILVRGATDYTWWDIGDCVKSNICPETISVQCKGEDVSRNTQFLKWIK
jgi:V8-like Glu-specific endopeptidase